MSIDIMTRNRITRNVIDGDLEVVFNRENGLSSDVKTIQFKHAKSGPDSTGNTYDLGEAQKRYGADIVERLTHARAIATLRCKVRFEEAALVKLDKAVKQDISDAEGEHKLLRMKTYPGQLWNSKSDTLYKIKDVTVDDNNELVIHAKHVSNKVAAGDPSNFKISEKEFLDMNMCHMGGWDYVRETEAAQCNLRPEDEHDVAAKPEDVDKTGGTCGSSEKPRARALLTGISGGEDEAISDEEVQRCEAMKIDELLTKKPQRDLPDIEKIEMPAGDATEAQLDRYLKIHGVVNVRWNKDHNCWASDMDITAAYPVNLSEAVLRFPDGCDALEIKLIMVTKLKEIRRHHRERITNKLREARKAEVQRRSPVTKTVDRAAREAILRVDERFARRIPATETIERLTREVILRHGKETEALIGRRLAAAVFGDDKLASPEIKEAIFAAVKEIVIDLG